MKKPQKLCPNKRIVFNWEKGSKIPNKVNQIRITERVTRINVKSPKTNRSAEGLSRRIWSIYDDESIKNCAREEDCFRIRIG